MCKISLEFEIGLYNGSMGVDILVNNEIVTSINKFDAVLHREEIICDWPAKLSFKVHGKGDNDTQVDENGNITADKYVKLKRMTVDRIDLHEYALMKLPLITTETDAFYNNYWGFNGTATIELNEEDSFMWHLKLLGRIKNLL